MIQILKQSDILLQRIYAHVVFDTNKIIINLTMVSDIYTGSKIMSQTV